MKPDIVVDIGNSRMKWGWDNVSGTFQHRSLDADDSNAWQSILRETGLSSPIRWAVASVHPIRLERFLEWIDARRDSVCIIDYRAKLPIDIAILEPDSVGIDRLLGAVAANARRHTGHAAITVDAGTAVTMNRIDPDGKFRGGAILPGFRLMAASLNDYTAKLPLVEPARPSLEYAGETTVEAIRLGIYCAVIGAIREFERSMTALFETIPVDTFFTGGNALLLTSSNSKQYVPTLNLEGIRIAAEALP